MYGTLLVYLCRLCDARAAREAAAGANVVRGILALAVLLGLIVWLLRRRTGNQAVALGASDHYFDAEVVEYPATGRRCSCEELGEPLPPAWTPPPAAPALLASPAAPPLALPVPQTYTAPQTLALPPPPPVRPGGTSTYRPAYKLERAGVGEDGLPVYSVRLGTASVRILYYQHDVQLPDGRLAELRWEHGGPYPSVQWHIARYCRVVEPGDYGRQVGWLWVSDLSEWHQVPREPRLEVAVHWSVLDTSTTRNGLRVFRLQIGSAALFSGLHDERLVRLPDGSIGSAVWTGGELNKCKYDNMVYLNGHQVGWIFIEDLIEPNMR